MATRQQRKSVEIHTNNGEIDLYEIGDAIQTGETEEETETIDYIDVNYLNGFVEISLKTSAYQEKEDTTNGFIFKKIVTSSRVDINYEMVEVEN